jgi:type II secretory pathway pseudopilin PulG
MQLRKKDLNSLSPSDMACPHRDEQGYALVILLMVATLMLIALTAALPSIYQEGQREREEELIFRGKQYARAIALFYRQFHRYPVSVEDLLSTSGFRFLRRAYPDPMTRQGKWRFIHAGANGAILDSKTLGSSGPNASGSQQNQSNRSSTAGAGNRNPSAFFGDSNQTQGVFIVGVATPSKKESIRVWDGHSRYEEWEFMGTTFTPYAVPQMSVSANQSGQGTTSSQQPFSPGSSSPTNPFSNR